MEISRSLLCICVLLYYLTAQSFSERNISTPANSEAHNNESNSNTTKPNNTENKNDSNSDPSTGKKEEYGDAFLALQMTFYLLVLIIGVIGNVLVLLTVTSKRMRSVKNLLIGNLAAADLTILIVCVPVTLITLFISWPFGAFICRYVFPLTDVVVSVSVITLCVITLDRFRAIVYPFAEKMSQKTTIIVIVVIWIVSYVLVAVPITRIMKLQKQNDRLKCIVQFPTDSYRRAYRLIVLSVLYIVPVCLIFFCFVCIGLKIKENMRFARESVRDSRSLARVRRRSRIAKIMFVIFLTFTICLLPIHLMLILGAFYKPIQRLPYSIILYHVALLILTANSCMNPIILYILSSEFKRSFKDACICVAFCRYVRQRRSQSHTSKLELPLKDVLTTKVNGNGTTPKAHDVAAKKQKMSNDECEVFLPNSLTKKENHLQCDSSGFNG